MAGADLRDDQPDALDGKRRSPSHLEGLGCIRDAGDKNDRLLEPFLSREDRPGDGAGNGVQKERRRPGGPGQLGGTRYRRASPYRLAGAGHRSGPCHYRGAGNNEFSACATFSGWRRAGDRWRTGGDRWWTGGDRWRIGGDRWRWTGD